MPIPKNPHWAPGPLRPPASQSQSPQSHSPIQDMVFEETYVDIKEGRCERQMAPVTLREEAAALQAPANERMGAPLEERLHFIGATLTHGDHQYLNAHEKTSVEPQKSKLRGRDSDHLTGEGLRPQGIAPKPDLWHSMKGDRSSDPSSFTPPLRRGRNRVQRPPPTSHAAGSRIRPFINQGLHCGVRMSPAIPPDHEEGPPSFPHLQRPCRRSSA